MKRRDFLLLAGVMSVPWTLAAAELDIPRVGLIHAGSRQENQGLVGAFQDGLSALGWIDAITLPLSTAGPRSAPRRYLRLSRS